MPSVPSVSFHPLNLIWSPYLSQRFFINFFFFEKLSTGRSHASHYALFRVGQAASDGFKEFAETGRSDSLDAQSQGEGGIFDEFNAPPVTSGEGRTWFFNDFRVQKFNFIQNLFNPPKKISKKNETVTSSCKVRKFKNVFIFAQQVSLAARIVPSPDWFIGLDSFNLCIDGQWVDSVAIKVIILGSNWIIQILILF